MLTVSVPLTSSESPSKCELLLKQRSPSTLSGESKIALFHTTMHPLGLEELQSHMPAPPPPVFTSTFDSTARVMSPVVLGFATVETPVSVQVVVPASYAPQYWTMPPSIATCRNGTEFSSAGRRLPERRAREVHPRLGKRDRVLGLRREIRVPRRSPREEQGAAGRDREEREDQEACDQRDAALGAQ